MMGKPDAKESDITEYIRQAESDFKDDVALLRSELGALATQNMFSKDVVMPIVCALGCMAAPALVPQLGGLSPHATIGAMLPLVAARSKYLQQRLEIQKKHPTSYTLQLRRRWI